MIPEFSVVTTSHKIGKGRLAIPKGTRGTVVYCHKDGEKVEVEFSGQHKGVITLDSREDICDEDRNKNQSNESIYCVK